MEAYLVYIHEEPSMMVKEETVNNESRRDRSWISPTRSAGIICACPSKFPPNFYAGASVLFFVLCDNGDLR